MSPVQKSGSSFWRQWADVHVLGSLCQAWAGLGEVVTGQEDRGWLRQMEKAPVLNSRPGTASGTLLHYEAVRYVNVIGLNGARGCLTLLVWHHITGQVCFSAVLLSTWTHWFWHTWVCMSGLKMYLRKHFWEKTGRKKSRLQERIVRKFTNWNVNIFTKSAQKTVYCF